MQAVTRKDYDDRRRRQAEGIDKAKAHAVYKGRPVDQGLHGRIRECLSAGLSVRKTAIAVGCAISTVQRVKAV